MSRRTVYAITRVLFRNLFPSLLRKLVNTTRIYLKDNILFFNVIIHSQLKSLTIYSQWKSK